MAAELTAALLHERIVAENGHEHETVLAILNKWLAQGYGIAIYVNRTEHATWSGQSMYVSYGGPDAILPVAEAPEQMAGSTGYMLEATYRGEPMQEPS